MSTSVFGQLSQLYGNHLQSILYSKIEDKVEVLKPKLAPQLARSAFDEAIEYVPEDRKRDVIELYLRS